jgi:hypothetical protein
MTLKDFKERFQAQDITHDFFELNEKAQKVFRINLNRLVIYITDWLPSAILLYSHVLHTTGK